jgi:hypothetical protein
MPPECDTPSNFPSPPGLRQSGTAGAAAVRRATTIRQTALGLAAPTAGTRAVPFRGYCLRAITEDGIRRPGLGSQSPPTLDTALGSMTNKQTKRYAQRLKHPGNILKRHFCKTTKQLQRRKKTTFVDSSAQKGYAPRRTIGLLDS